MKLNTQNFKPTTAIGNNKSSSDIEKEILEIITQHKFEHINTQQAMTEILRLVNVSGTIAYLLLGVCKK